MIEKIRPMADEVASLMAARYGGLRRGHYADLEQMLRRRGGALPRKLRRDAILLAKADRMAGHPKLARQVDFQKLDQAHHALTHYLRPLGQGARFRGGVVGVTASVILGLMVLGAIIVWVVTLRGLM
ncbi:hypothetical protein [Paracoccus aestuariivivens]|uniref:Uncharacterized protein n=1 Tax=Paracoccus aestuariivivens TaxID=1820333 RepID=A0A6L6J7P2_9RHOB|nr:hypothetical protein [Paracoccus aestuariivivens]MTH76164.1 hypothetical protein [Paracoccus aestuariivivens]